MLYIVDLVERETITIDRAAWLLSRVNEGSSWLVGAKPGGAGKTAVMCALLAMLPSDEPVHLTNPDTTWRTAEPGHCILAYELSPGGYDAYVWGNELRQVADLGVSGCRLVSNLHADTLEQARAQLVDENGVSEEGFGAFGIFIPLQVKRFYSMSGPTVGPMSVYQDGAWLPEEDIPSASNHEKIIDFLHHCLDKGIKTVEDVRDTPWLGDNTT